MTEDAIEVLPASEAATRFPAISRERMAGSVQLVRSDGRVVSGAEAVFSSLAAAGRRWPLWMYRCVPGFAWASERAYRLVANHREGWGRADVKVFGATERPGALVSRTRLFRAIEVVGQGFALALAGKAIRRIAVLRGR